MVRKGPPRRLNAEQVEEFMETWDLLAQGDTVDAKKLGLIMRALSLVSRDESDKKLEDLVKEYGSNGKIDSNGFLHACDYLIEEDKEDPESALKAAFREFDKNGNGYLDVSQMRHVLANLGEGFTEKQISEMLSEADVSGTGKIYYDEFVRMMMSH